MKIFIEGYSYEPDVVRNILPENRQLRTNEKIVIEHVGYFRNPACDDFVFFLPKVLLEEVEIEGVKRDRVFAIKKGSEQSNGFAPEDIIDPEAMEGGRSLSEEQKSFLYEFSVWIYRAIAQYIEKNPKSNIVFNDPVPQTGAFRRKIVTNTLLDVILALIRFHRDNRDYFLFKIKEKHSGTNKINWTRTISKTRCILQENTPIYLNPINKTRSVDFDEELLVLFYSILDHIHNRFGFPVHINMGYELIKGAKFEKYLNGYGIRRLHAIKYKYFSDRDLTLWQLCYAFFEKSHKANVVSTEEEYLLAKNFEIVFESIIDDLIGDENTTRLKKLSDGKKIDHLYFDESLTRRDNNSKKTFYIADSKYYKRGNSLGEESISKQFTYARDFLQLDLDIFLDGENASEKRLERQKQLRDIGLLRDETTEGYDIIPNFFISATISESLSYTDDDLHLHSGGKQAYRNIHFENRLFDRDTLILSHYDVNFLYIIKLYAQNDANLKRGWRDKVRTEFRNHIRELLKRKFSFYAMMPYDNISDDEAGNFLRDNFKLSLGKIYSPYLAVNGKKVYSLALENPEKIDIDDNFSDEGMTRRKLRIQQENETVKNTLKSMFYIIECGLGENPSKVLQEHAASHPISGAKTAKLGDTILVAKNQPKGFTDAVRMHGVCPWLASACKNPYVVEMLIFPYTQYANVFYVNHDRGVFGPYSLDEVRTRSPEFSKILNMPDEKYYIWSVREDE